MENRNHKGRDTPKCIVYVRRLTVRAALCGNDGTPRSGSTSVVSTSPTATANKISSSSSSSSTTSHWCEQCAATTGEMQK